MKIFLDQSGVSAGTYGTNADSKSLDECGAHPGKRNCRVVLDVSAVAGASPNIVAQLKGTFNGRDFDLGSPTPALTGVGAQTTYVEGCPEVVWVEVTASGTITASSLSFQAAIEAV